MNPQLYHPQDYISKNFYLGNDDSFHNKVKLTIV